MTLNVVTHCNVVTLSAGPCPPSLPCTVVCPVLSCTLSAVIALYCRLSSAVLHFVRRHCPVLSSVQCCPALCPPSLPCTVVCPVLSCTLSTVIALLYCRLPSAVLHFVRRHCPVLPSVQCCPALCPPSLPYTVVCPVLSCTSSLLLHDVILPSSAWSSSGSCPFLGCHFVHCLVRLLYFILAVICPGHSIFIFVLECVP